MADARQFAKLDLGYFDNPKVADFLDDHPRVLLLHLRAITYCRQHLTNGTFPIRLVSRMVSASYCGSECESQCDYCRGVSAGLFDRASIRGSNEARSGSVHDYLEHQQSSEDVKKLSAAGRKGAKARWSAASDADRNANRTSPRNGDRNAKANAERGEERRGNTLALVEPRAEVASFEDWYRAYPRKRGRGQAEKAYKAALKKTTHHTLMASVTAQADELMSKGADKCPYPATWLNGERWEDEADPTPQRIERGSNPFNAPRPEELRFHDE